jgi:Flp pilus assembly pilin Flp
MNSIRTFWNDESGAVVTAEAATVASIAVLGTVAGLSQVATSLNHELNDVARAIRSLDQSYCTPGFVGCGACTAGSFFRQEPVAESLQQLQIVPATRPAATISGADANELIVPGEATEAPVGVAPAEDKGPVVPGRSA